MKGNKQFEKNIIFIFSGCEMTVKFLLYRFIIALYEYTSSIFNVVDVYFLIVQALFQSISVS